MDAGRFCLAFSEPICDEYFRKLDESDRLIALFARRGVAMDTVRFIIAGVITEGLAVFPAGEPPVFIDEKDRCYLHCAETVKASYLVTFDKALLALRTWQYTTILTPAELLAAEANTGRLVE
jgi:predicted nucleic acid-binding protein